jgi:hypothetical protein
MLTTTKKITIEGKSVIDGAAVAGFVASIDSQNPSEMILSSFQINKAAYKEHRVLVRADEAEFEDYAYSIQDAMLAELDAQMKIEVEPEAEEPVTEE